MTKQSWMKNRLLPLSLGLFLMVAWTQPGVFPSPAVPGGLEAAASIVSGIGGEIAGGITGLAAAAIPGLEPGAGEAVAAGVRERLTFDPRTEEGKKALESIGGSKIVKTIGDALTKAETTDR